MPDKSDSIPLSRDEIMDLVYKARNALLGRDGKGRCQETLERILESPDRPEESLSRELRRANAYIGRTCKLLADAVEHAVTVKMELRDSAKSIVEELASKKDGDTPPSTDTEPHEIVGALFRVESPMGGNLHYDANERELPWDSALLTYDRITSGREACLLLTQDRSQQWVGSEWQAFVETETRR